jgi:hypothetical protein
MKLSLCIAALISVANAASISPVSSKAIGKLMNKSRRLEEGEDAEEEEEEEFAFLADYSIKFITCKAGEKWVNPENGEYEYGVAIYRLCPGCDDDVSGGCKSGYGEYVVGLNTFVDAYFEDQRENMGDDDAFNLEEYAECGEYEAPAERRLSKKIKRNLEEAEEEVQYFIGPTCSEGDIKLQLFSDEDCTAESDVDFTTISGGMNLPYSSGGLVPTDCKACYETNDNGEEEISDFCMQNYEASYGNGCESNMDTYSANGKDESACEYISQMTYVESSGGGGGWWIFWLLVIVAIVGVGGYFYLKKKSKSWLGVYIFLLMMDLTKFLCYCFGNYREGRRRNCQPGRTRRLSSQPKDCVHKCSVNEPW